MPAYNFQPRFVDLIVLGKKTTTIRRKRSHPTRGGDKLTFYTGQRTKRCARFAEGRCTGVWDIMIRPFAHQIRLRGAMLSNSSMLKLAKADGFEGISDFFKFFQERYGQEELTDFQLIEFSITGCMEE